MLAKCLKCVSCKYEYPLVPLYECKECGGILEVDYDYELVIDDDEILQGREKYCKLLPIQRDTYVWLGEGNTALVEAKKLSSRLGIKKLLLKCEFRNPTGSFKDRPVSIGISKAVEFGYKKVIVASSGNGAASVAAYAARTGLEAVVLVPESTPYEKVIQTLAYGAKVIRVKGPYSNCFALAKEISESFDFFNVTTTFINPYTVEGDKTVAYELLNQMDYSVPDLIYVPIGAGPLLAGIYKGYFEAQNLGVSTKIPRMVGIQAEGCSPIARAFLSGHTDVIPEENPQTIASGICDGLHGYAKDGTRTLQIIKQSNGFSLYVSDTEITEAQNWLAREEGIFVEPSAAAIIAGIAKSIKENRIRKDCEIVCILTGHGLKDMKNVKVGCNTPVIPNQASKLIELLRYS